MRIAAFLSHPIQHFTPLWQELSKQPGVELKVFYCSKQALKPSIDPGFGVKFAWDVDLLAGHDYEFLPRQWPTKDPLDYSWKGLNKDIYKNLKAGWDVVYVAGYDHINNWRVAYSCKRLGIPLLCQSDVSILTALDKGVIRRMFKRLIVPRFLKMVSGYLAVGDHSRDYFIHYGADPEHVFFCPIPVDISRFRSKVERASEQELTNLRAKYGIPPDKKLITFSGKLIPRKRPQDLVAAIEKIDRNDVACLLIGDGQMRSEIERIRSNKIVVTGFVNQSEVAQVISLGTISVMPSSYDAHPLAVTESLCLGIPVILSDRCGCYGPNDVLRDGEDGLLYRCGDIDDLVQKLTYLLDDKEVFSRMSNRARELAETQSPQAAADCFLKAAQAVQR